MKVCGKLKFFFGNLTWAMHRLALLSQTTNHLNLPGDRAQSGSFKCDIP